VYLRREKEYGWWKVTTYPAMPSELAFAVLQKWSGVKGSRGAIETSNICWKGCLALQKGHRPYSGATENNKK